MQATLLTVPSPSGSKAPFSGASSAWPFSPRPLPLRGDRRAVRVGLLGGSFNPAHDGHRYISLTALQRFALDEVWWLVSPQNPLKARTDMGPLERRLARAEQVARHPRIRVTALESTLGTQYTADTLPAVRRLFPCVRFVWLMGADNLVQISRWQAWEKIFETMPIAVLDRGAYSFPALAGKAARRFASARWTGAPAKLADCPPPAWFFYRCRRHAASATALRAQGKRV